MKIGKKKEKLHIHKKRTAYIIYILYGTIILNHSYILMKSKTHTQTRSRISERDNCNLYNNLKRKKNLC